MERVQPKEGRRRKKRSDRGEVRVTERDLELFTFIWQQYAIRFDQLMQRLDVKKERAEKIMTRLRNAGYIECKKILADNPRWIWLTSKGVRAIGKTTRPVAPSLGVLAHHYEVTQARFIAETRGIWVSERDLIRQSREHRDHIPDGALLTDKGNIVAIEVELTLKTRQRLGEIITSMSPLLG